MNTPILATGLSGMVGTRISRLLENEFEFEDLSYATNIDITNPDQVETAIAKSPSETVLHLAAKADVDGCEDDKILLEDGPAWQINVEGTANVAKSCKSNGKFLIYISTDFVFNGTKDSYTETDEPDPVNWYGYTKYEGEKIVAKECSASCIVRIAYPYLSGTGPKIDFARRILQVLREGKPIKAVTDHIITPTFTDDIAKALSLIIRKKPEGIFHVVGSSSLSVYDASLSISDVFNIKGKITATTREEYFSGRAYRPYRLKLNNDRIRDLGCGMSDFVSGLKVLKKQLETI